VAVPVMLRVVEREALVFRRLWRGIVFTQFVQPVLYLAAMGVGLGALVDANSGSVDGLSYLDFVAPALLVASAMQLATAESLWPVLAGVIWMRFYHGTAATPIRPGEIFCGFVVWIGVRTAMSAVIFLVVAACVGAVSSAWGVAAIGAAVLTAAAFAAPVAGYSIRQETDLAFPLVMRLGVLPLFLFSGTFFPVSQLPSALQPIAYCSPLWHGIELARGATTGDIAALAALGHVAFLLAVVGAGAWWGARGFNRRLCP